MSRCPKTRKLKGGGKSKGGGEGMEGRAVAFPFYSDNDIPPNPQTLPPAVSDLSTNLPKSQAVLRPPGGLQQGWLTQWVGIK